MKLCLICFDQSINRARPVLKRNSASAFLKNNTSSVSAPEGNNQYHWTVYAISDNANHSYLPPAYAGR